MLLLSDSWWSGSCLLHSISASSCCQIAPHKTGVPSKLCFRFPSPFLLWHGQSGIHASTGECVLLIDFRPENEHPFVVVLGGSGADGGGRGGGGGGG